MAKPHSLTLTVAPTVLLSRLKPGKEDSEWQSWERRTHASLLNPERNPWSVLKPWTHGERLWKTCHLSYLLFQTGVEDDEDYRVLSTILEDKEEDILHPNQSRPQNALEECSPSLMKMDIDLLKVCCRAVARSTGHPGQWEKGLKGIYDGKRLLSCLPPARQLIPAILACVAEMKWDKPFSQRVPIKSFLRLDFQRMEDLGMAVPPPVETSVANHLHPSHRVDFSSARTSLPGKTNTRGGGSSRWSDGEFAQSIPGL